MPTISSIFIDTNVFVALEDISDSTHDKAVAISEYLVKQSGIKYFTSSEVVAETFTVLSRKLGNEAVKLFLAKHQKSNIIDIFLDEQLYKETVKRFVEIKKAKVSFVDCSNVIIMKRNKIGIIFSFDEDFRKMGVGLLGDLVTW